MRVSAKNLILGTLIADTATIALVGHNIPADRLVAVGMKDNGRMQLVYIDPNVAITDGPLNVELTNYKPGINLAIALDDTGTLLVLEDDKLDITDAAELINITAPLMFANGTVRDTNWGMVEMPSPTTVNDRIRLHTQNGNDLIIDGKKLFGADSNYTRYTASHLLDEATGTEYVAIAGEYGNTVYLADAKKLATVTTSDEAVALFNPTVIDGKIDRMGKPISTDLPIYLTGGKKLNMKIDDGTITVNNVEPMKTAPEPTTDNKTTIEAKPTDTVGKPLLDWSNLGATGITDTNGDATLVQVKPTDTTVQYLFVPITPNTKVNQPAV